MNNLLLLASFAATGAAWGMAWLGGFGVLKKDMCNPMLLRLITLVFVSAGSVYAVYYCYNIYGEYKVAPDEGKQFFQTYFSGNNLIVNGGRLLIQLSPIVLIVPPLRKSRMICAVVGVCYVLLPFYAYIIAKAVN